MRRRDFLMTSAAGLSATTLPWGVAHADEDGRVSGPQVVRTATEYAETLLGTDVVVPRLSWVLEAAGNSARQSAYQVEVGTAPGRADVWQSGRVTSDVTTGVPFGGKALRPRTRYHWRVRVWDGGGRQSAWSAWSWWETALLGTAWTARWIGAADSSLGFGGASWIWSATTPPESRWFRTAIELPSDAVRARLVATADDDFTLYVNGSEAVHVPQQVDVWKVGQRADVTTLVKGRRIVLAVRATNRSDGPAGLLLRLLVDLADGTRELVTGPGWKVSATEQPGWQTPDFDDGTWAAATVLQPYGQGPWGSNVTVVEQPSPLLRKEFTLGKPVASGQVVRERARVLRDRDQRQARRRPGARSGFHRLRQHGPVRRARRDRAGAPWLATRSASTLGRGFYGMKTPNAWSWERPPWHDEPKLLAQLEIDHPDGTRTTIASDETWRITDGPTLVELALPGRDLRRQAGPARLDETGLRRRRVAAGADQARAEGHAQSPGTRADPRDRVRHADCGHHAEARCVRGRHGPHDVRLDAAHRQGPRGHGGAAQARRDAEPRRHRADGQRSRHRQPRSSSTSTSARAPATRRGNPGSPTRVSATSR